MAPPADRVLSFAPPGPGSWTLDLVHFPQPATQFVSELFGAPAKQGFAEATARYGLLMDYIEWRFVHGWAYLHASSVQPLGADLTREGWEALVRSSASLRKRLAASATVFDDLRWRAELARWDAETKPRMRQGHEAIQGVQPASLDAGALLAHLERCRVNLERSIYEHHRLNAGPVIPVGDFLVRAHEWTGLPAVELVSLVRDEGHAPGAAGAELTRMAQAVRADPAAAAILNSGDDPGAVLDWLASRPGAAGRATSEYLALVGCWSTGTGFDVVEPYLLELPHLLLATVQAAVEGGGPPASGELVAEVRGAVPAVRRAEFDAALLEARATHRVRDERAIYCDVWAYGLTRRAILAGGERLAEAGALEQPEHLLEAGYGEIRSLLAGGQAPSADELAARASLRAGAFESDAPVVLGESPARPVPTEWLAPGAARTERAFRTYIGAMSGEEVDPEAGVVVGTPASAGTYEGRARILRGAGDLGRVERGDVLVTGSTTPALSPILPLLGAIVTDRGGLLSHAAIVAREFGIPAIVGTGDATSRIPDGSLVVVDGASGHAAVRGAHSASNRSR